MYECDVTRSMHRPGKQQARMHEANVRPPPCSRPGVCTEGSMANRSWFTVFLVGVT